MQVSCAWQKVIRKEAESQVTFLSGILNVKFSVTYKVLYYCGISSSIIIFFPNFSPLFSSCISPFLFLFF